MASLQAGGDTPAAPFVTPTKRAAFTSTTQAGPSRASPQGASPAYSSRRHSLYGIEDRIVIDPGSRIWKVGFSGETEPRAVFWAQTDESALPQSYDPFSKSHKGKEREAPLGEMWDLDLGKLDRANGDEAEANRLIAARINRRIREVYSKYLMTDSKSRKVIIVENTYLPSYVKEHLSQTLFDNLKASRIVPSISFTPSSLLALAACGRITGLVVDIGWLETTVTPVYYSRPLYHLSRSTPRAGRLLHRRLTALLRHHGQLEHPPTSMTDTQRRTTLPPEAVLTDHLVEKVFTQGCFVGSIPISGSQDTDVTMEDPSAASQSGQIDQQLAEELHSRYRSTSAAKDWSLHTNTGHGAFGPNRLVVPGWVRERAGEIFFQEDIEDEAESLPDLILNCISKLSTDLKSPMISSLLITGGTASLPGLIPRLRITLKSKLLPPPDVSSSEAPLDPSMSVHSPQARREEIRQWRKRQDEPYKTLYGLVDKVAILNDPCPIDGSEGISGGGTAPRWTPGLVSWVGGSLAGALKTGGKEITREEYDTNLSESLARAEIFDSEREAALVDLMTEVGMDIEDLKPGEAALLSRERKRGWKEDGGVGDWSRPALEA